MTLSLAARTPEGAFGIVIASSSPAVAARCVHLRAGVGAVTSQNITNPALGAAALDALEAGASAPQALVDALATDEHAGYRQLGVLGLHGAGVVHSGANALGVVASAPGDDEVAAGNLLAHADVPAVMARAFRTADGSLEERMMIALETASRAGGEAGPLRSAGLAVVEGASWRVTDLRVDDHDDPVAELRRLLDLWMPQRDAYLLRALSPAGAPSYGVPGDE